MFELHLVSNKLYYQ